MFPIGKPIQNLFFSREKKWVGNPEKKYMMTYKFIAIHISFISFF